MNSVETASSIPSAIVSAGNVVAGDEGVIAGGVAEETTETETSIEVADEGLIEEARDIQDHPLHIDATLEIVVHSASLLSQEYPIHMFPVEGDEIIEEGLPLLDRYLLRPLGPCRTRAPRPVAGLDRRQDLGPPLADVGLGRQTDVVPIVVELKEDEGETRIGELDEGHLRILPCPVPHARREEDDHLLDLSARPHLQDLVDLKDATLALGPDLPRARGHEAAAPVRGCLAVGIELGQHQLWKMKIMSLMCDTALVGVMNVTNVG